MLPLLTRLPALLPPATQLKRCEHEGDWPRALLTYDLVLQQLGPPGGGSGDSGGATQQAQQGTQRPPSAPGSPGARAAAAAGGTSSGATGAQSAGSSLEGISRQAAVAGLLRSLAQLGAGHLASAYAQSVEVADGPAAAAALSLGQWGQLGCAPVSSGGGGCGGGAPGDGAGLGFPADAALPAALAGLQAGSLERCRGAVCGAQRGLVAHLVAASLEGAASVNPALVRLQMLQAVSEAWELRWPALPDLGSVGSPRKRRKQRQGEAGAADAAAAGLRDGVLALWRAREAAVGRGGRYDLQAPLQVGPHARPRHSRAALSSGLLRGLTLPRNAWPRRPNACKQMIGKRGTLLAPRPRHPRLPPRCAPCRACTSSCCTAWARRTGRPSRWWRALCRHARQARPRRALSRPGSRWHCSQTN